MGRVYFLPDCRLCLVLGMTANMPKTSFAALRKSFLKRKERQKTIFYKKIQFLKNKRK